MYNIPVHIKLHVNRLVREYEILYHQGHKISLHMFLHGILYPGLETTEYYLNDVRNFRKQLDTQDGSIFIGSKQEVRRKIYKKIIELYAPLSPMSILRITSTTDCQEQLERTLRSTKKNPVTSADAKNLSWFISNACTLNWCQYDEAVNHKVFKLIKNEDAFEKLLKCHNTSQIIKIAQNGVIPYTTFRIASIHGYSEML